MKYKINIFCSFIIFLTPLQVLAEADLNHLIKEQQNNDHVSRRENRIDKKDVYSSVEAHKLDKLDVPAEKNCIEIKKVSLENDFLKNAAIKKIQRDMAGRCLGAQGIEKMAVTLQDYFISSGFVTTRVEIPQQDLTTHQLLLKVIPGRIEKVIIEDNDVRPEILPFNTGDILNIRDIEQGLENLQSVPGVNVKVNIAPGSRDGYSNVMIATNRTKKWNVRASYNNWGDESTGQQLVGGAGYLYNLAKMNDIFYLSGNRSSTGGYKSIGAYYSFPFGYWDYELFYSKSASQQGINIDSLDLNYRGKSEYWSLKTSRIFYRDKDKKITGIAEIFRRKANYKLDNIELVLQDRDMDNVRFGVNYKQNLPGAQLDGTLTYQRFLTWFGGSPTPGMKSGEVSPRAQVINLDLNYTRLLKKIPIQAYYNVKFGVQYAPEALTLQDQMTLGDRWNVRGFEKSSGLYGDSGYYIQNTLNFITGVGDSELYMGADYGQVSNCISSQDDYDSKRIMGATAGVKGSIRSLGYDVSLTSPILYPDNLNADKFNINFQVYYQL
jgi:hemolysin activation/secretion protein